MMAKRKCKVCGTVFEKQRPLQFVCSPACGIEYQREQKRKAVIKSEREAKRKDYVPAGRSNKLRFDEDNVHGGCVRCNLYESGNIRGYRQGLIERIGLVRVEELDADHEVRKWTKEDLRELAATYRKKAREIE